VSRIALLDGIEFIFISIADAQLNGAPTNLGKSKKLGIRSGTDALPGQYPHMAFITGKTTAGATRRCQGSLIFYNLVVTSGK
jgi:hypothetical protein